jgi:hypothetical protein
VQVDLYEELRTLLPIETTPRDFVAPIDGMFAPTGFEFLFCNSGHFDVVISALLPAALLCGIGVDIPSEMIIFGLCWRRGINEIEARCPRYDGKEDVMPRGALIHA